MKHIKQLFGAWMIAGFLMAICGMSALAAGDKYNTAEEMDLGKDYSDDYNKKSLYYKFTVSDPGKYQITGINNITSSTKVYLKKPNTAAGGYIAQALSVWDNQNSSGVWTIDAWLPMGSYYLIVSGGNQAGSCTLCVTETTSANESFPSSLEDKEALNTANEISIGNTYSGMLSDGGNTEDYYRFTALDDGEYKIMGSTGVSSKTTIRLLRTTGTSVATIKSQNATWDNQTSTGTWDFTEKLTAGTYYIKIIDGSKKGLYSFSVNYLGKSVDNKDEKVSTSLNKTSIKKVTAGKKQIIVDWKEVKSGITGYEIQYSTDKKFKSNKTKTVKISKRKTTSKHIKKLKKNTKYYVRIRTYKTNQGEIVYSKWSNKKSIKTK